MSVEDETIREDPVILQEIREEIYPAAEALVQMQDLVDQLQALTPALDIDPRIVRPLLAAPGDKAFSDVLHALFKLKVALDRHKDFGVIDPNSARLGNIAVRLHPKQPRG